MCVLISTNFYCLFHAVSLRNLAAYSGCRPFRIVINSARRSTTRSSPENPITIGADELRGNDDVGGVSVSTLGSDGREKRAPELLTVAREGVDQLRTMLQSLGTAMAAGTPIPATIRAHALVMARAPGLKSVKPIEEKPDRVAHGRGAAGSWARDEHA